MRTNNTLRETNSTRRIPVGVKAKFYRGAWWVFIHWRGKRKSKRVGLDQSAAERVAEKISAKLALGNYTWDEEDGPTFKDYSKDWLEKYIKSLRRDTTYRRYKSVLKQYIWPEIGAIAIEKLKRSEIRDLLLKHYKSGNSTSMLLLLRDVISGVMNYAVDDELVPANPVRDIIKTLGIKRDRQTEVQPFTSEEVSLILNKCGEIYPEYYPFMLAAFRTGMRLGEILALKWEDIDWNSRLIHVRRSYRNRQITKTKTGKSRRVEISGALEECLRWLLTERKKEALAAGSNEPVSWVFHSKGGPIAQNSVRYIWRRLLSAAGIRYEKFHAIRHTYASLLLSAGESAKYVKEQLGHSSIQITIDIYGHFMPSESRRGVSILDGEKSIQTHPIRIRGK